MDSRASVKVDHSCNLCGAPVGVLIRSKDDRLCVSCGLKVEPPMLWLASVLRQLSDSLGSSS